MKRRTDFPTEAETTPLISSGMERKTASLGEEVEAELTITRPPAISILHKQGGAGCLRPTALWSCWCPISTKRSFNWIGENAILKNKAFYLPWEPISCAIGGTFDLSSMKLLDQGMFLPCCHGASSPCGPRGYATQEDLFKCGSCIDCLPLYDCLLRPCCGEILCTVPCENGSRGFNIGSTPFPLCHLHPVGCCMADSKAYRAVLMEQVAHSQGVVLTNKQRRAIAPQAHGMTR